MSGSRNVKCISTTQQAAWRHQAASVVAGRAADLELGWIALSKIGEQARRAAIESLFDPADGCRFTRCRMPIGASDYAAEWYSLNETDGDFAMEKFSIERDRRFLIPYIKAAQQVQPKLELFASPWSPPTWLKCPRAYNHGTLVWEPNYLKAYALYLLKAVQAYRAEGIPITQIHVQNEPLADQKFPSCLWTGPQLRDFIRDHLGPLFARSDETCEIWLGTLNTDDYDGYPHLVLSDPAARAYVAGVGFQWAGKGAVQRTAESWRGVRLLQTENECGDGRNTWDYAHSIFDLIRHYVDNGVCGYTYWNMVLEPEGRSTWGWRQNAMMTADPKTGEITLNPEFYVMKHWARFIDPGAVRLGLRGPWTGNAAAFANPGGSIALAIANPFADARDLVFNGPWGSVAAKLEARSFNTIVVEA